MRKQVPLSTELVRKGRDDKGWGTVPGCRMMVTQIPSRRMYSLHPEWPGLLPWSLPEGQAMIPPSCPHTLLVLRQAYVWLGRPQRLVGWGGGVCLRVL